MTTAVPSANSQNATRRAVAVILALSAAAMAFLFWLIYVHPAMDAAHRELTFLPALDALLNGLSATALLMGFAFIRGPKTWTGRIKAHRTAMLTAFGFSVLFLVSYITNYALHGESHYPGHSLVRTVYLIILVSHILLSMICLPLVLITFYLSLSGRIPIHRKVARWTFPIWLYVSVTGVVVYGMLAAAGV
jgi:putative membrane protein